jgi:hypothetical protein
MRSNISTHIGLEGLFIVIVLVLCGGANRMVFNGPGLIALGSECPHSFLSGLVPTHWTKRVGPAILGFQMAYCAIECEPTISWCMRSIRNRVNLVYHDVDMEVLLVVVSNENVLVFLEAKLVQRV